MKKCVCGLLGLVLLMSLPAKAQEQEIQQLLLDVEKLAQFKQILKDLETGYQIIYKGYTTIKDLSEGNFNLHKTFLDGLLQISPAVRNYKRIADILSLQLQLVKEYKAALRRLRTSHQLTVDELNYIEHVYSSLFSASLQNLDALTTIITAGKLRMSDEERLSGIDQIHSEMLDKLTFLRHFNSQNNLLVLGRLKESKDIKTIKLLYGIQ